MPTMVKAALPDLLPMAARDIELAASDLIRCIREAQTVSDALRLHAVALLLQQELARVGTLALDRADALCGD